MTVRPHRALAAAAVAALLALAGCGGGGDDDQASAAATASSSAAGTPSGDPSPAASGTPADADPSAATGAGSTAGPAAGLGDVLQKTIQEGRSAHVTLDMGSQGSGEGDISLAAGSPAMQLEMTIAGQRTEVRMVDGVVYVAAPGASGKFMKMDLGRAGDAFGMDPSKALEQLEKSGGRAKDLGDGHWQLSQDGVTTDVYVGDDGFLQRMQVDGGGTGTVSMTYSDWGKEVSVEAPPRSDVVDMPGALPGA